MTYQNQCRTLSLLSIVNKAHVKLTLLLVVCTLAIQGCSTFKGLIISNLDYFMMREIDKAFDLTEAQEKRLNQQVPILLRQLADNGTYLEVLNLIKQYQNRWKDGGMSAEDSQWMVARVRSFWLNPKLLSFRLEAAKFLSTLEDANWKHFREYMSEKTEERFELRTLSPASFKEEFLEKSEESFEKWYGSITETQKQKLFEIVLIDKESYQLRYMQRAQAEKSFISFFTTKKRTEREALQAIEHWLKNPETLRTGIYRKAYLDFTTSWQARFAKIDALATKQQQKFAWDKLEEIKGFIRKLHDVWKSPVAH